MTKLPLYLTEADVARLVTIKDAIATTEAAFAAWRDPGTANLPRARAPVPPGFLNLMGATYGARGVLGHKAYFGNATHFSLYSIAEARLVAVIESDLLGQLRTGAASGIATRALARPGAKILGCIGTGKQARTQIAAVCAVRPIDQVRVFSRAAEKREAFARQMRNELGIGVVAAASAEACVRGADVVVIITKSVVPVCRADWIAPGAHVNAAGANAADRREVDADTVLRADVLVTDHRAQAQIEAAEFIDLAKAGRLDWANVHELGDVVAGKAPGRTSPDQLTLFKSLGIALEDVAFGELIYRRAVEAGAGRELERAAGGWVP
jgi:ornithine cyclodeaminase/alanine dehydrogenase-like protein (mu-crystallin family)